MKKYLTHSYRKYLTLGVFSLASLILGSLYVMAAGGPIGYTYCVDEGGNCVLGGSTEVAYGANGYFLYLTADIGTSSIRCTNSTFGNDPIFGTAKACYKKVSIASVMANLPWLNSQGVAVGESQSNGFAVAAGISKEVTVWSECKKITAGAKNVFVPSLTQNEWNKFKAGAGNIGATLGACGSSALPVNGLCSTVANQCSAGTVGNPQFICESVNAYPACDSPLCVSNEWECRGSNGGTTAYCATPIRCSAPGTCSNGASDYPTCTPPATVVNGACNNNSPGVCTAGASANDDGNTTAGGTRTWNCLGSGVGATNASCSYANPVVVTPINCTFTVDSSFGSCSATCNPGGSQYKYYHITSPASNGGTCAVTDGQIAATNACNVGIVCPSSCTPSTSTSCTASCGGTCTDTTTASNCSTSTRNYANPTVCTPTCTPSTSTSCTASCGGTCTDTTTASNCSTSTRNYANPTVCPPTCTPSTSTSCTASCGGTCTDTTTASNCSTSTRNYANPTVCPPTCTPSTSTSCTASCGGTCTDTTTASNCSTSTRNYANPTVCALTCQWVPSGSVCGDLAAEPLAGFPDCDSSNVGSTEVKDWVPAGGSCGSRQRLQVVRCQCN